MNYVYIIHAEGTNFYKIGVTKDLEKRLSAINNTSPYRCYILYKIEYYVMFLLLHILHKTWIALDLSQSPFLF